MHSFCSTVVSWPFVVSLLQKGSFGAQQSPMSIKFFVPRKLVCFLQSLEPLWYFVVSDCRHPFYCETCTSQFSSFSSPCVQEKLIEAAQTQIHRVHIGSLHSFFIVWKIHPPAAIRIQFESWKKLYLRRRNDATRYDTTIPPLLVKFFFCLGSVFSVSVCSLCSFGSTDKILVTQKRRGLILFWLCWKVQWFWWLFNFMLKVLRSGPMQCFTCRVHKVA